jgi:hypothetical protein
MRGEEIEGGKMYFTPKVVRPLPATETGLLPHNLLNPYLICEDKPEQEVDLSKIRLVLPINMVSRKCELPDEIGQTALEHNARELGAIGSLGLLKELLQAIKKGEGDFPRRDEWGQIWKIFFPLTIIHRPNFSVVYGQYYNVLLRRNPYSSADRWEADLDRPWFGLATHYLNEWRIMVIDPKPSA